MNTRLQVQTKTTPKPSFIPVRSNLLPQRYPKQAEPPLVPPILHDMLPKFQAKLTIGQPNDQYEQEADRVAEQVMRMPEPKIQRVCPECEEELQLQPMEDEEEEEETLQTKPLAEQITPLVQRQAEPMEEEEEETLQTKTTSGQPPTVSSSLQNRITALQGGGQPLSQSERAFFEPRFGADFSQVRVHADSQAAEMAGEVNARAFTVGRDIVFGTGQYQPSASGGRHLLAHELVHTMQQRKGKQILPDFWQQVSFQARLRKATVPSLQIDGVVIQRIAIPRLRRRVDNRPELIHFDIDRPASHEALITQVQTDLTSALHSATRRPIFDRLGSLNDDLHALFDRTEGQSQISFALRLVWSNSRTVDHLSLLPVAAEAVMRRFETLPPMQWVPADLPRRGCSTDFCWWVMQDSETRPPALASTTTANCWEAILLAAFYARVVSWSWLHDLYVRRERRGDAAFANMLSRRRRMRYAPPRRVPVRGDIVFFWTGNHLSHVGLATGRLNPRGTSPEVVAFQGTLTGPPIRPRVESPTVHISGGRRMRIEYVTPPW